MDSIVEQSRKLGAASVALTELLAVRGPDSSLQYGLSGLESRLFVLRKR